MRRLLLLGACTVAAIAKFGSPDAQAQTPPVDLGEPTTAEELAKSNGGITGTRLASGQLGVGIVPDHGPALGCLFDASVIVTDGKVAAVAHADAEKRIRVDDTVSALPSKDFTLNQPYNDGYVTLASV